MLAPLLRVLAGWTVVTITATATTACLAPIVVAPATRIDTGLVRICAGLTVLVVVGLWATAGVGILAHVRQHPPAPGRRRPRPIAEAAEAAEAPEAPEAPEALR